ncbi:MAG: TetR/AcrR family transcriptional regulator [Paludibacteraceae bacterium]
MTKTDNTRTHIITAAAKLFAKFGFDKTSMEDIAHSAHKAKRSLYNHFPGKEELFIAVAEQELAELQNRLQVIFDQRQATPLARLKTYLLTRMDIIAKTPSYKQFLSDELYTKQTHSTKLKELYNDFERWEYGQLICLWSEYPDKQLVHLRPNAIAFADMLQMTMRSLSVTFFVQNKYNAYQTTYNMLVNIIVDSILGQIHLLQHLHDPNIALKIEDIATIDITNKPL